MSENQNFQSSDDDEIVLQKGFVYQIENPETQKIYIGSSFTPQCRMAKHRADYRLFKKEGILISNSGLIFDASENIHDTKMSILEVAWCQNRKELERLEKKHILQNKDFCVNQRCVKTDEEKKKEHNDKMRYLMRKKYEEIEYISCPICHCKVKQHRFDKHKVTRLCNRRSEKLVQGENVNSD